MKEKDVEGRRHGNFIQVAIYVKPLILHRLREISERTRVPMSRYVREGIEYILKRYG